MILFLKSNNKFHILCMPGIKFHKKSLKDYQQTQKKLPESRVRFSEEIQDSENSQKLARHRKRNKSTLSRQFFSEKNLSLIKERTQHKKLIIEDEKLHSIFSNKHIYKELKSISYQNLKPFINVQKMFKIQDYGLTLGDKGCACKSDSECQWKTKWTKGYTQNNKIVFEKLLRDHKNVNQQDVRTILKDLPRTFSYCQTFRNQKFLQMLRQVLVAYSIYDTELGYIQGFNNIAGVLLYHIQEPGATFWALVELLEQKELRQIYLQGFKKLNEHCRMVNELFAICFPDMKIHLKELDVDLNPILYGLFLSLMSTCVSLEFMHYVIDGFKKDGWDFLYRVILTYFAYLKDDILATEDSTEFLMLISSDHKSIGNQWVEILLSADRLSIDDSLTFRIIRKRSLSSK